MSNPFGDLIKQKKVLLAAHRGSCGGNIPCNSLPAYKIALNKNADIVELDVEVSSDGVLFIQHPRMERVHLRFKDSLRDYPASFIEQMTLSNNDMNKTAYPILRLSEALEFLKGKCVVNIDKFWGAPDLIAKMVREMGMQDQVIVKAPLTEEGLKDVEDYASDLPYMPLVRENDDCLDIIKGRNIRYIGSEAIFTSDDAYIASDEYVEKMHKADKLIWVNAIVYNYKKILTGDGHTDDVAMIGDPEKGWGWLADKGYDVIQTDFIQECDIFLKETGRRN